MSDRIAVMRDGRIEQLADSDTIYGAPASAYVAAFVGQQNFFDGRGHGGCRSRRHRARTRASGRPDHGCRRRRGGAARRSAPSSSSCRPRRPEGDANLAEGRVIGVSHLGETMQFLVQLGARTSR